MRLVGAYVVLDANNQVTSTDALGNFRFDGLPDGTYTLKCTFIGYRTATVTVSVNGNETRKITQSLQKDIFCRMLP